MAGEGQGEHIVPSAGLYHFIVILIEVLTCNYVLVEHQLSIYIFLHISTLCMPLGA